MHLSRKWYWKPLFLCTLYTNLLSSAIGPRWPAGPISHGSTVFQWWYRARPITVSRTAWTQIEQTAQHKMEKRTTPGPVWWPEGWVGMVLTVFYDRVRPYFLSLSLHILTTYIVVEFESHPFGNYDLYSTHWLKTHLFGPHLASKIQDISISQQLNCPHPEWNTLLLLPLFSLHFYYMSLYYLLLIMYCIYVCGRAYNNSNNDE